MVNANTVFELPFGAGKSYLNQPGILPSVFGSWQLTTVVGAHTGFPVNVTVDRSAGVVPDGNTNNQRPSILPGISLIPPGGATPSEWINLAAFAVPAAGTFGDAPRDVARAPGLWQTDSGLSKRITFREPISFNSEPKSSTFSTGRNSERPTRIFPREPGSLASSPNRLTQPPSGPGRHGRYSWRFDSNSDSQLQAWRAKEVPEGGTGGLHTWDGKHDGKVDEARGRNERHVAASQPTTRPTREP